MNTSHFSYFSECIFLKILKINKRIDLIVTSIMATAPQRAANDFSESSHHPGPINEPREIVILRYNQEFIHTV